MNKSFKLITPNGIIEISFPICISCKENPVEYHKNVYKDDKTNPFQIWHKIIFISNDDRESCTLNYLFGEIPNNNSSQKQHFDDFIKSLFHTTKETLLCSECLTNKQLSELGQNVIEQE
ncbi:MAG: hypothetical protein AABY22_15725 [Nanoarchaeota archaeon]